MKIARYAAVLAVAWWGAAGCDRPVNTVERAQPLGHPQTIDDKRIIRDSALANMAVLNAPRQAVVSGNLLKVEVDVYNSYSSPQSIYYKYEWYDGNGMYVDSPMSIWRTVTIQGGEKVTLTGLAPNPRCQDFRLKLQQSQNN